MYSLKLRWVKSYRDIGLCTQFFCFQMISFTSWHRLKVSCCGAVAFTIINKPLSILITKSSCTFDERTFLFFWFQSLTSCCCWTFFSNRLLASLFGLCLYICSFLILFHFFLSLFSRLFFFLFFQFIQKFNYLSLACLFHILNNFLIEIVLRLFPIADQLFSFC